MMKICDHLYISADGIVSDYFPTPLSMTETRRHIAERAKKDPEAARRFALWIDGVDPSSFSRPNCLPEGKKMKVRDWVPPEFDLEYGDTSAARHLDATIREIVDGTERPWPGRHKFVFNWIRLWNGKAIGWNENPAIGWSFPVIRDPGRSA
jgi:predicted Rdx family selenoprotein